jgi:hypothetical protein
MQATPAIRYRVAVHRLMGCYFARVVDLPGCICRGASEVDAIENARAAIRGYLWIVHALAGDKARVEVEITAPPGRPDTAAAP